VQLVTLMQKSLLEPVPMALVRRVKDSKQAEKRETVDGRISYRLSLPAKATRQAPTKATSKRKAPATAKATK